MAILNLDPNLVLVLAGILVVLGLVLAFFGRGILKKIIGFIGMILGGVIGYLGRSPSPRGGGCPSPGPRPVGGVPQTRRVRGKRRSGAALAAPPVVAPPPPPPQ